MLNAFYDRVERDELISPLFPGGVSEKHRRNVTTWWCEVFGGPAAYTSELGGYEHMLAAHRNLGITNEQRLRFVTLLSQAADDAELPDDPEFRSALMAYAEWGTPRARELTAGRRARAARAGPAVGLGRGAAVRSRRLILADRGQILAVDHEVARRRQERREGGIGLIDRAGARHPVTDARVPSRHSRPPARARPRCAGSWCAALLPSRASAPSWASFLDFPHRTGASGTTHRSGLEA
jgi:hemoglobin